jgi:predicted flap endonuclease-1-like 5' DNA nuclease
MDPSSTSAKQVRFYRTLALCLFVGMALAYTLPLAGIGGLGIFTPDEASVSLMAAILVLGAIVLLFLLRIGRIFDVEGMMEKRLGDEARLLGETQRRQEDAWAQFKNDLKQELTETRTEFRRSQEDQEARFTGIGADAAGARRFAEELAATRSLVQKSQNEIAPLLVDLRARMEAQEQKSNRFEKRLVEALDNLERREMEAAALRTKAEQELANLRKREQLLLIKQRELEETNEDLVSSKGRSTAIPAAEASQHVMTISSIGAANASRLNAMGIITIPQLAKARPENVGPAIGVETETVREWQSIADLLRVEGVAPTAAEMLVKSGVRSVPALAAMDSGELSRKLLDVERARRNKSGLDLGQTAVAAWITSAREGRTVKVAA